MRLYISGMTCNNCKRRVESKLRSNKEVKSAYVNLDKGYVEIETADTDKAKQQIEELGYSVNNRNPIINKIASVSIIIAIYMVVSKVGLLNMLVPGDLANSEMGYIALFITGLLTSVHCVAMCGGINASCSGHGIQYNIGRVISYTVTGFILGGIGMTLGKSEFTGASTSIQGLIKLIAGSLMLYMCLSMLGLVKKIQLKKLGTAHSAFGIGLLNGLMPCGPLQTMQIGAFSAMNPLNGALSMLAFSLGTLPLMLGFSFVSNIQKIKWLSTYI